MSNINVFLFSWWGYSSKKIIFFIVVYLFDLFFGQSSVNFPDELSDKNVRTTLDTVNEELKSHIPTDQGLPVSSSPRRQYLMKRKSRKTKIKSSGIKPLLLHWQVRKISKNTGNLEIRLARRQKFTGPNIMFPCQYQIGTQIWISLGNMKHWEAAYQPDEGKSLAYLQEMQSPYQILDR